MRGFSIFDFRFLIWDGEKGREAYRHLLAPGAEFLVVVIVVVVDFAGKFQQRGLAVVPDIFAQRRVDGLAFELEFPEFLHLADEAIVQVEIGGHRFLLLWELSSPKTPARSAV